MTAHEGTVLRHVQTLFGVGAIGGLPDGHLLSRYAARSGEGSEAAFAELVQRHGPMVLRACRGILREEHAAHDAFQVTFLVLARKAGRLWVRDSLGPWLHGVACRVASDARKAEARRLARQKTATGFQDRSPVADWRFVDNGDLLAVLHEEIGRLTATHRAVVVLCDLEGHTHEQAAQQLGCPVGTIKSRQARARERLRVRLTRRGLATSVGSITTALAAEAGAAVPPSLTASTAQAVLGAAAGTLSPAVAAATQRALRGLTLARTQVIAPVLLVMATATGVMVYRAAPAPSDPDRANVEGPKAGGSALAAAPAGSRLDPQVDPLPPGARLRLGTLRPRQKGAINGIVYAPDGKALVTGSENGEIQVRDPASGQPLRQLDADMDTVRAIALAGDGKAFAAVGFSFDPARRLTFHILTVLDFATGRRLSRAEWGDEQTDVWSLAIAPDGASLATGSGNGVVRLWDAGAGVELLKLKLGQVDVRALAFSPDGSTLAACSRDGSGNNNRIHLIDLEQGHATRTLTGHKRPIRALAFSPDGKALASGADEETVILWDVATGRELRRLDGGNSYQGAVAFSPDGASVAASGGKGVVTVWDAATGRQRRRMDSADDSRGLMAFSPDGKTVASSSSPVLHLWDLETGRDRLTTPDTHEATITRLLCAEGGKTLVTGSDDGTARVWDLATGRQRAVLNHKGWVRALALSPDGKLLATGVHHPDSHVRLWELATGKELRSWPGRGRSEVAMALAFTTDGAGLLSLWRNGSIRRFEVVTGNEVPTVQPRLSQREKVEFPGNNVDSGLFSPDGSHVAAIGLGNPLRVADTATGQELYKVPADTFAFTFSEDGKTLAVADHVPAQTKLADGRTRIHLGESVIRLLDVMTGKELLKTAHPDAKFSSLAFTPDGKVLAAAQAGKTNAIRLYRTEDGRELHTFRGHGAHPSSLRFTPDGRSLVSGLQDTTVLIWDVPTNP